MVYNERNSVFMVPSTYVPMYVTGAAGAVGVDICIEGAVVHEYDWAEYLANPYAKASQSIPTSSVLY